MDVDSIPNSSESMERIAKLTLVMAIFMLIILIMLPFSLSSSEFEDIFPYLLYSLFLTSVGVLIGTSMTWLLNRPKFSKEIIIPETERNITNKRSMLSSAEKLVVDILESNNNKMWQAELVRQGGFTNSKASRLLSNMEYNGLVIRVRDGMGKRVELVHSEEL